MNITPEMLKDETILHLFNGMDVILNSDIQEAEKEQQLFASASEILEIIERTGMIAGLTEENWDEHVRYLMISIFALHKILRIMPMDTLVEGFKRVVLK